MNMLSESDIYHLFLIVAVLMMVALLGGSLCKKFNVPCVIGELAAGIVIGPTVFGALSPGTFSSLFRASGEANLALNSLLTCASLFLLFVVGLEIKVPALYAERRPIGWLGTFGIVIPFLAGLGIGYCFQDRAPAGVSPDAFAMLIGAAFAVSALPVIARILMDLGLLKSRLGVIVIGSAAVNDIIGWLIFVFALSLAVRDDGPQHPIWMTALATTALVMGAATIVPWLLRRALHTCERAFGQNAGTAALVLLPTLFMFSALTAYLGIHALFGAFVAGIAVGALDSVNPALREGIETLTRVFFAPFYFVSVGLRTNFLVGFDAVLVLAVLVTAFASKLLAALIGGYLGGLTGRESVATGLGLTARGGMGVILASIAYAAGAIALPMLAALIIMAITTSFSAVLIPHVLSVRRIDRAEPPVEVSLGSK